MQSGEQKSHESVPTFTVVTPVLNGERFIRDAVESVLAQGIEGIEHIVVDGGSTDGTVGILREYPHLTWISEADDGQSSAVNRGIRMARGAIIGWLNADDVYRPGAFHRVLEEFEDPAVDAIYSNIVFVDRDLGEIRRVRHHPPVRWFSLFYCFVPSATLFFRNRIREECLLDESLHLTMDAELVTRLLFGGKHLRYVDDYFAAFRWHDTNKTRPSPEYHAASTREHLAILRRHVPFPVPDHRLSALLYTIVQKVVQPARLIFKQRAFR